MKLKSKIVPALLLGVVLFYTACKKSGSSTSNPTLTPKEVTSQIALNLSQSLSGGLGAFDISGGLDAPSTFAVRTKGKVINDLSDPSCGLVLDTAVNFTDTENGSTVTFKGTINFAFACTNGVVSGFSTNDNLDIALTNAQISFAYKVNENLTFLSSNPLIDTAPITIKGSLSSSGAYQLLTGSKASGTEVFNYTLTSLILDPNSGEIASGSASFTTSGTGPQGVWNYTGTITFLGNNQAKVTINGTVYTVDLQSGAVS